MHKAINIVIIGLCLLAAVKLFIRVYPKIVELQNNVIFQYNEMIYFKDQKMNTSSLANSSSPLIAIVEWDNWMEPFLTKKFTFDKIDEKCAQSNCIITKNLSKIQDADVVLFRLRYFDWSHAPKYIRKPHQIYILYEHETVQILKTLSGEGMKSLNDPRMMGYFNWTIGYRRDAQIQLPNYDFFKKTYENSSEYEKFLINLTAIVKKKTKLVVQFVSKCNVPSKRELYTKELQKFIQVDVFGNCGPKTCGESLGVRTHHKRLGANDVCKTLITKDYKFYLAFENSICKDYITEKFNRPRKHLAIPIVLRGSDYLVTGAPPHSFIAADSFKSVQDLANYLRYLDGNETAYIEYFDWHKTHYIKNGYLANNILCEICKKYNDWVRNGSKKIVYEDMKDWFVNKAECVDGFATSLIKKGR